MWMLICLLLTVICLCGLLRKRFEEMLAPVTMATILVLYGLSFEQHLLWFPVISGGVFALTAALLIWRSISTRGGTLKDLFRYSFTPGMAAFAILTVVLFPTCMKQIVIGSDDIRFWGLQAHSVWAHNGLTDAAHHLSPRFMTYTPGMQMFQWLGMYAYGEWNEGVAHVMRSVFSLILLVPFAKPITWKKVWLLPFFLVFSLLGSTAWHGWMHSTLIIDSVLGLSFGYCLICLWNIRLERENRNFHLACAALGMCVLALLKQAGIAWVLMTVAMKLFVLKPCSTSGLERWKVGFAAICPLITLGTWQWFVTVNHLRSGHYDKTLANVGALIRGEYSIVEAAEGLGRTYVQLFLNPVVSPEKGRLMTPALAIWVVVLILLPLLIAHFQAEHRKQLRGISIWSGASLLAFFAGYTLILVTAFLGAEKTDDGLWAVVLNCRRYFTPLFVGIMFLLLYHLLHTSCSKGTSAKRSAILLAAVFALLLPCMDWGDAIANLDPNAPAQDTDLFWEIDEANYWRYDLEEPQNAIVLYGMMPATFNVEHLQYVTAPVKLVLHNNDPMDQEGFVSLLKENQVTHIICIDDYNEVYELAQEFAGDGWLDVHTLYEVEWDGDIPVLWAY